MNERSPVLQGPSSPTQRHDAAIGISWFALPLFVVVTMFAIVGEMFTKFADAGFGYYFIMLGMPAYCVAWLCLLVYATFRAVLVSWPVAALVAAGLTIVGYATIG